MMKAMKVLLVTGLLVGGGLAAWAGASAAELCPGPCSPDCPGPCLHSCPHPCAR